MSDVVEMMKKALESYRLHGCGRGPRLNPLSMMLEYDESEDQRWIAWVADVFIGDSVDAVGDTAEAAAAELLAKMEDADHA